MPEQQAVDKNFNLRSFYPYEDIRHLACLHSVGSMDLRDSFDTVEAEMYEEPDDDVPIQFVKEDFIALVHPRWCSSCVARRTAVLSQGLVQRLARIDLFTKIEAIRRNEKAYVEGVVKGRIKALAVPLNECAGADTTMDADIDMLSELPAATLSEVDQQIVAAVETGDMQALINSMFEIRLTEGVEELVSLMKRSGVTDAEMEADQYHCELEVELELAIIANRAEQQGMSDGRMLQARLEQAALNLDDFEARQQRLEQAVL